MQKNNLLFLLFFLLCFSVVSTNGQNIAVLFYNVENLFDLKDNPDAEDDDFLPGGARGWNSKRLDGKLKKLSKVILASGGWHLPDVIGLAEIENKYVLERLLRDTPLKKYPYRILHKESPDRRGIEIGVMYNEETFYPLQYELIPLMSADSIPMATREIFYLKGVVNQKDTLHVLFNHWPSRYSGLLETYDKRVVAARILRNKIQAINKQFRNPYIIVMGDFNDQPTDDSIVEYLLAQSVSDVVSDTALYNLSYNWLKNDMGTLKFQSQWFVFDQIIVSGNLLTNNMLKVDAAFPVKLPFLLEKDKKYGGYKLFRTYNGFKYNGGFSDHIPILLQLSRKE